MSGKRDEMGRWARHRLPGNFGLGKRGKHEGAEEVRAEALDDEAGDEPELNRRIRGLVISRRTALTLPAVIAGMGILGTFGIATPASATAYDQWVESLSSEGKTAIQKSYYYVSRTPAADGSILVKVRTTLYHKTSSNGVVRWQSTKDFYDQYDGGRKVGHIGEDWRNVDIGQTLEQGTEFYLRGGGTHHITSTETDFRGNSGVHAGWEFWVDIPYTGHVSVRVFAIAGNGRLTPPTFYRIRSRAFTSQVIDVPWDYDYNSAVTSGTDVGSWGFADGAIWGQTWFGYPLTSSQYHFLPLRDMSLSLSYGFDNVLCLWDRADQYVDYSKWNLVATGDLNKGDRPFRLSPQSRPGHVITYTGTSAANGTQLKLTAWSNLQRQQWILDAIAPKKDGTWGLEDLTEWPTTWRHGIVGAKFGLYYDAACTQLAETLTVNDSGNVDTAYADSRNMYSSAQGNLYLKMLQAPKHLQMDGLTHITRVMSKQVIYVPLQVKKYRARFWRLAVGATADNGLVFEKSVWAGEGVTPPANPTRVGYTFDGWNPSKGWEALWSDMDFLAIWVPIPYTVTWKDGVTGKVYKTGKYNYGSVIPAKEYPGADEHEGYRKDNWDRQPGFHMPAHDVVITFNYVRQYTVHYMVDGSEDTSLRDERIDVNTAYTIPAEKARKASKPNCDPGFDGWYSEQARRNKVTQVKVTGDVWVWAVNRVTVSYVVVTKDGNDTIHTVTKNYGDTISSAGGDTGTALEIAKRKYTDKVIEYAKKWFTDEGGHNSFTTVKVGGNTSIYLVLGYSNVLWYCDGEDDAHIVDRNLLVASGTWIGPDFGNAAARLARAKKPNCTPGWRGWYLDKDAPSLHPERASAVSAASLFEAAPSDAQYTGQYLGESTLGLYSANIATVSFARAAGSEPVPEADVTYHSTISPAAGDTSVPSARLQLPAAVQASCGFVLTPRNYATVYQQLTDGTGRWRTLKPSAWHRAADAYDAAFRSMTVTQDAMLYVKWVQATADGVVDSRY